MDETMNPSSAGIPQPSGIAREASAEALKERAGEVGRSVQEKAVDLRDTTRARIEEEVARRSTDVGSAAREVASAVRRTSEQLRGEGKTFPADVVEKTADGIERAGVYLEDADAERVMQDVRSIGRRRPWLFVSAGAAVGFAAARLLRSSGPNGSGGRGVVGSGLYEDDRYVSVPVESRPSGGIRP